MDRRKLEVMIELAQRGIVEKSRVGIIRNPDCDHKGRFVLFHAAMSFCSQKVRATLTQRGTAYKSNEMLILGHRLPDGVLVPAENYSPDYVRLRLQGREAMKVPLVKAYSGISSVTAAGLDPCAVPTLVDLDTGEVIVDSLRICFHIDSVLPGSDRLTPVDPAQLQNMQKQLNAVDLTPHPGLLYGFHPEDDRRPEPIKQAMSSVYEEKIEALNSLIIANEEDWELAAAYRAKIAKEAGGSHLRRDRRFQLMLRDTTRNILLRLDADLRQNHYDWLCAPELTLADLFWAVSLVRLKYLGLAKLWSDLPTVDAYLERLLDLPSIQSEVLASTISSMPRSEYLAA
ncbi:glutathione S-transferase family protein [Ensifer sp. ENS07]|uniref:glutathione S-transferase family protein n=1 Tax=unclassified Ensifer TaxID=2633371 RepID=UPI0017844216|nr:MULTISPECIES: glutathione S-transferase [unclassified Ensifer]MBD9508126.1 glutathione S-transferase family protein [Ensifer sp. ENS10]MBD9637378.1 glutathione S-transferase family protein [Ensifer sp. ENS07]